jgi:hypothetical protein
MELVHHLPEINVVLRGHAMATAMEDRLRYRIV